MNRFITTSEEETIALGIKIAQLSKKGVTYTLKGDMAAGKTKFSQGFAKGLLVDEYVTSPTFNVHNVYKFNGGELHHFDFYRITSEEEAFNLYVDEYFGMENTICLIEWPENIENLIPKDNVINIYITKISENEREFLIN